MLRQFIVIHSHFLPPSVRSQPNVLSFGSCFSFEHVASALFADSNFTRNCAVDYGGAIAISGSSSNISIIRSKFTENRVGSLFCYAAQASAWEPNLIIDAFSSSPGNCDPEGEPSAAPSGRRRSPVAFARRALPLPLGSALISAKQRRSSIKQTQSPAGEQTPDQSAGGAILLRSSHLILSESLFINNTAQFNQLPRYKDDFSAGAFGGAVALLESGFVLIDKCQFKANSVYGGRCYDRSTKTGKPCTAGAAVGGALFIAHQCLQEECHRHNTSSFEIRDTNFVANIALGGNGTLKGSPANGGAISVLLDPPNDSGEHDHFSHEFSLNGCLFDENQVWGGRGISPPALGGDGIGGAFYIEGHNTTAFVLRDTTFRNNWAIGADGRPGNYSSRTAPKLYLAETQFSDGGDAFGGAVAAAQLRSLNSTGTIFEDNVARAGQAFAVRNTELDIVTSGEAGNGGGGALLVARSGSVNITALSASNNHVLTYSRYSGNSHTLVQSDIYSSLWRGAGGALWLRASRIDLDSSSFRNHIIKSEVARGGTIWIGPESHVVLRNLEITNSSIRALVGAGGCIYLSEGSHTLMNNATIQICSILAPEEAAVVGDGSEVGAVGGGISARCPAALILSQVRLLSPTVVESQLGFGGGIAVVGGAGEEIDRQCRLSRMAFWAAEVLISGAKASFGGAFFLNNYTMYKLPDLPQTVNAVRITDASAKGGSAVGLFKGAFLANEVASAFLIPPPPGKPVYTASIHELPPAWNNSASCGELKSPRDLQYQRMIWPGSPFPPVRALDCLGNTLENAPALQVRVTPDRELCPNAKTTLVFSMVRSDDIFLSAIPLTNVVECSRFTGEISSPNMPFEKPPPMVYFSLGQCPPGTRPLPGGGGCDSCPNGKYSLDVSKRPNCSNCPAENDACLKFDTTSLTFVLSKNAYFSENYSPETGPLLIPCLRPSACASKNCQLLPPECVLNNTCATDTQAEWGFDCGDERSFCNEGYEGHGCGSCSCNSTKCFFSSPSYECKECKNSDHLIRLIAGAAPLVVSIGLYVALPRHNWPVLVLEISLLLFLAVNGIFQGWLLNVVLIFGVVTLVGQQYSGAIGYIKTFVFMFNTYSQIVDRDVLPDFASGAWSAVLSRLPEAGVGIECISPKLADPAWQFATPIALPVCFALFLGILSVLRALIDRSCHNQDEARANGASSYLATDGDINEEADGLKQASLFQDDQETESLLDRSFQRANGAEEEENDLAYERGDVIDQRRMIDRSRRTIFAVFIEPFVLVLIISQFDMVASLGDVLRQCQYRHMYLFPSVPCDGSHRPFVQASWISLALIGIALPLLVTAILFRNRRKIQAEHPRVAWMRFLHLSYKPSRFWYETVWMLCRVLLALSISAVSQPLFRSSVTMGILVIFAALHLRVLPHETKSENRLTSISYGVLVVTMASLHAPVLSCKDGDLYCAPQNGWAHQAGFFVLLVVNAAWMLVLLATGALPAIKRVYRRARERWCLVSADGMVH